MHRTAVCRLCNVGQPRRCLAKTKQSRQKCVSPICPGHLSPSNTGWEPSEQEGVEPSAHCLPRPPGPRRAETRAVRRTLARRILIMAAAVWCLVWSGEGARCSGYIDTETQCNTDVHLYCIGQEYNISDSWDFENQQFNGAEISAGKMTKHNRKSILCKH